MQDEEASKKDLENLDEINTYFAINECGGFIWRMRHEMSHGRIPEKDHPGIMKDIERISELQQYAVTLLPKFGVETPTEGPNNAPTQSYWKWFRWWDSYVKGLPDEEWKKLNNLVNTKGDYSAYRPAGDWRDVE